MTTMLDVSLPASRAAAYLAAALGNDRDYTHILMDQRAGTREDVVPFWRDSKGHVHYYQSMLDQFIHREASRTRATKPLLKVERSDSTIGATLPPTRVLDFVV